MCSLTPPSSARIQNRLLGGVEGECSLLNGDFSSQDINSDINSKIMQLELKRARLEAQITLSKTQTMLAEMELHLVEIELRHELWRHRLEAQVRPPASYRFPLDTSSTNDDQPGTSRAGETSNTNGSTNALFINVNDKSQTRRPYRRLLVRKQIRPTGRPRYRKPKTCTQEKRHETTDDTMVIVEENEQLTDGSRPGEDQSRHKQVGEFDQTKQGEVVTNHQRSLMEDASEIDPQKRGEKPHNSRSNPDQCHPDAGRGESPPSVVPEIVENRIEPQDAALIANSRDDTDAKNAGKKTTEINKANIETNSVQNDNIIGKEDDKHQYVSRKEQKSDDSKAKTLKKVIQRTYEGKTASSNTCVNKDEEAENNNNDMHETNTETSSARSQKSEKKSSTNEKLTAVKNNSDLKNNGMKTCSITMVRIPIRLRTLSYCISPEINNNDVNTQNSETDGVAVVDTTISQIKDIESTPREKRTLSGSTEANSTNAMDGTTTGAAENIAQKLRSTCVKVVHKEQNTIKKYSNEKKRSEPKNIEGKENVSNVSKEKYRSRDSKTKSSNKDKKYESKRNTTSTSNNSNRDKEAEKNKNNDRHKSNADKSHDKSRRTKNTGSHRHKKDENGTNKDNAKNKENQPKPITFIKICFEQNKVDECNKIESKSSSVERAKLMKSSSRTEGAKNNDAVGDKETENNDNYFLGRETDAFDCKSNILDKTTQELQDMGNNLLFEELRNCNVKKERSLSLSSLETLKLYEN